MKLSQYALQVNQDFSRIGASVVFILKQLHEKHSIDVGSLTVKIGYFVSRLKTKTYSSNMQSNEIITSSQTTYYT